MPTMPTLHRAFVLMLLSLAACATSATAADNDGFVTSFHEDLDHGFWYTSNGWANGPHQSCEWRAENVRIEDGNLQLALAENGGTVRPIGCAEMHSNARFGFGLYEARMRTAAGSGLNTAFFTYVGPNTGGEEHDEIDFEFLGKDPSTVQINYFIKGKSQLGKVIQLGFDASKDFHNYAIEWSKDKIRWYVDRKMVFETPAGAEIPQYPGRIYLSLWSGASGEDAWMGPFHYTAPLAAAVTWAAFTPEGQTCQFPQSAGCKKP